MSFPNPRLVTRSHAYDFLSRGRIRPPRGLFPGAPRSGTSLVDPVRDSASLGPTFDSYFSHRVSGRGARFEVRPTCRIIAGCARVRAAAPRAPRPSSLMERSSPPRRSASGGASAHARITFWRARGPCEAFSRRDRARRRPLVLSRAPARPPSRAARPRAARPPLPPREPAREVTVDARALLSSRAAK